MKIVTWNCNGAFRKKFEALNSLDADILVIQECEDPLHCLDGKYRDWAVNFMWIGDTKHKGLGIFCKKDIQLSRNDWDSNEIKHFLSVRINNSFDVVAVWTMRNNSITYRYIGQFWKYLQINRSKMTECIILGDFNSNKIWDKKHRLCNHSNVISELSEIGIESLYHEHYSQQQGRELHPTFYMHRNLEKPYHIDYIFATTKRFPCILAVEVGSSFPWLSISDHLPVIAIIDEIACEQNLSNVIIGNK